MTSKKRVSEEDLRKDINLMVETAKEVLLKNFKGEIKGIYFKGSASKDWNSRIDYVPGISDVDMHVLFKKEKTFKDFSKDIWNVMRLSEKIEKSYLEKNKKPTHTPLLQLLSLNKLMKEENYVPSIKSSVKTIHGKKYEGYNKKKHGEKFKERAKAQILEHEEYLENIRKRGWSKTGKALEKYLHDLSWRLSSSASNFLCAHNYTYEEAWSLNRTGIVKELKKLKFNRLAKEYKDYYNYGWKYFYSGKSSDCRKAIVSGHEALRLMIEKIKK